MGQEEDSAWQPGLGLGLGPQVDTVLLLEGPQEMDS